MFEVERKYELPAAAQGAVEAALGHFGTPERLREEDLHGFTPSAGHYLRFRRSGERTVLVAKGPTIVSADGIRSRREVEVPLEGGAAAAACDLVVLLCCDLLPPMRRERLVWHLPDGEAVLDRLDDLPGRVFLELEVLSTDQGGASDRLRALEVELGLDPAWREVRSYSRLLQDAAGQPSSAPDQENVMNGQGG